MVRPLSSLHRNRNPIKRLVSKTQTTDHQAHLREAQVGLMVLPGIALVGILVSLIAGCLMGLVLL